MKDKRFLRDLALIAALFSVALIIFAAGLVFRTDGSAVEIRVNGETYAVLPLSEDVEFDIAGRCLLQIKNGEASIISATCRNHICVKHRAIKSSGEAIICLPNGVTVKVTGDGGTDFVI